MGALGADNLKSLTAWQVIISVGTLLVPIALGSAESLSAALFYMLSTTWIVAGLFLVADLVASQRGSAGDRIITAPMMRHRTFLSVLFMIGAVAAAGLPPFSGFFGKLLILMSVEPGPQMAWLWGTILVGGFLTLVAYSRAGSIVFWRTVDGHVETARPLKGTTAVAAGAMIALTVVIVAMAGPINRYTEDTAAQILDTSAYIDILQTPMVGEDD